MVIYWNQSSNSVTMYSGPYTLVVENSTSSQAFDFTSLAFKFISISIQVCEFKFHVTVIEYKFLKTMGLHVLYLLFIGKKWICNAWLCVQYSENGTDNHRGGQRDPEAVCWEQNVWWVHYDYMCRESERFHVHVKGEWNVPCTCVGRVKCSMYMCRD